MLNQNKRLLVNVSRHVLSFLQFEEVGSLACASRGQRATAAVFLSSQRSLKLDAPPILPPNFQIAALRLAAAHCTQLQNVDIHDDETLKRGPNFSAISKA